MRASESPKEIPADADISIADHQIFRRDHIGAAIPVAWLTTQAGRMRVLEAVLAYAAAHQLGLMCTYFDICWLEELLDESTPAGSLPV